MLELAAKIYEYEKFRNVQFRLKHGDPAHFDIQVLNHFYVKNMSIERKENPSLKDFKMVPLKKNVLEFVRKGANELEDRLDYSVLEALDKMKKLY